MKTVALMIGGGMLVAFVTGGGTIVAILVMLAAFRSAARADRESRRLLQEQYAQRLHDQRTWRDHV